MTDPGDWGQYMVMVELARRTEGATTLDLDAVYTHEFAYVWRTLQRLGVADNDLEDLVHEVFVVVHRRFGDYDQTRPLRPWLFGIALRIASKHRRRPRHRIEVIADVEIADPSAGADEQVAARQARERVLHLLQKLDLDRRAVFVMADLDGCSVPEIAETLQIPLNTAYSRLRSARKLFADASRRMRAVEEDV